MAPQQSLLAFGSQTSWPNDDQLVYLRERLSSSKVLNPLKDAVEHLDEFSSRVIEFNNKLTTTRCTEVAKAYRKWLKGEPLERFDNPSPNSLITSLTVLIHVIQYTESLDHQSPDASHDQVLKSTAKGGIQGFCSGILSALAISASKTATDIGTLSAKSFRLAFAIGALVDLDSQSNTHGPAGCIAVRWRSEESKTALSKLLEGVAGSYISVISDSACVSVTLPTSQVEKVCQELISLGVIARVIEVHGRFHTAEHSSMARALKQFCGDHEEVQLPDAKILGSPFRSNIDAALVKDGPLHELVIDSMLLNQSKWYQAFQAATKEMKSDTQLRVLTVGYVDLVPSSLVRQRSLRVEKLSEIEKVKPLQSPRMTLEKQAEQEDAIAIVGMSCKFPGADSIDEFWQLIKNGTTMLDEVAASRFDTKGLRRTADGKTPFWGCFVRDPDAFDHEFFKKSPREAASMDPKQRMLLEETYHAMESSGQWATGHTHGEDIGVYMGVATDDYYDNVNSHAPNAFSATGTLRAFLSGKISHFFGWTGPSITLDTACSGSLVAIHMACNAILNGECSRAVAGGVNAISSPNMYQNLAAATFLSKTGLCKPFDEKADGYCRGEGVGIIVLKKLSAAVADGDNVLGVINASVTNQNNNETAITVPHTGSQKDLYRRALDHSGIRPEEVSYVEAHGTGTAAGDPREISSIREIYGTMDRVETLHVGSVKGNIGHLEAASGIASLIKVILMTQNETIPPAASFSKLNPKIGSLEESKLAICTSATPWQPKSGLRVACINNYGASGNNAAMIVTQNSGSALQSASADPQVYPIYMSGNDSEALGRNCAAVLKELEKSKYTLKDVAHELTRTQSQLLPYWYPFKASSIEELRQRLAEPSQTEKSIVAKPVVLAFGGQSSTSVGLDKGVFETATIFRHAILECDEILRKAGLDGVIPAIFQTEPIEDVVTLHACFFTIQYATAMAWLQAGLRVNAVVGHSFGQLTALSVAGHLSLEDGLRLVTGRAALMKKLWGPVRGSMVSIEASTEQAEYLISVVNQGGSDLNLEIACYNAPNSHTLVGTPAAVDAVVERVKSQPEKLKEVKAKKLNVSHGFHSVFTEPLLPEIEALGQSLNFVQESSIHLETSSKGSCWSEIIPQKIVEHTRTPVYFVEAVHRLTERFGPCTWVEAGTGSAVTGIVRKALGSGESALHTFDTVNLNKPDSVTSLVDTTLNLWRAGHNVKFWPFHPRQGQQYSRVSLPPYQFKKSRHWIPYVDHLSKAVPTSTSSTLPSGDIVQFSKHLDDRKEVAEFLVNKNHAQFQLSTKGHSVLDQPLCPAGEYIELAVRAAILMQQDVDTSKISWALTDLSISAPLGLDPETPLKINLKAITPGKSNFEFKLLSEAKPGTKAKPTPHGSGVISLRSSANGDTQKQFSRISRLVDTRLADQLLNDDGAESLRGSLIYSLFGKVVNYADFYKGMKKVAGTSDHVAARVKLPEHSIPALNQASVNTLAIDNFLQVAGINVNCLHPCAEGEVYVCTQVEQISPGASFSDRSAISWLVYSTCTRVSDREVNNDLYVFDEKTDELCMVIQGVSFTRVGISTLARTIGRANSAPTSTQASTKPSGANTPRREPQPTRSRDSEPKPQQDEIEALEMSVRKLANQVSGVPLDSMKGETSLESTGMDSLGVHELQEEIKATFEMEFPSTELGSMTIANLASLIGSKNGSKITSMNNSRGASESPSPRSSDDSSENGSDTPATSVSEAPASNTDLSKLASFVAEQLGTTATLTKESVLADHGMDSLMSLELGNDIEEKFGVHIEQGWITTETTFGQLVDKVMPKPASASSTDTNPTKSNESGLTAGAAPKPEAPPRKGKIDFQTVMWKECEDSTKLFADIYLPNGNTKKHGEMSIGMAWNETRQLLKAAANLESCSSHDPRRWIYHAVSQGCSIPTDSIPPRQRLPSRLCRLPTVTGDQRARWCHAGCV